MDTERVTAYHEAGHAVAATVLGHPINSVTVVPGENDLGGMLPDPDDGQNLNTAFYLYRISLISLAGALAEICLKGTVNKSGVGITDMKSGTFVDSSDCDRAKKVANCIKRDHRMRKIRAFPVKEAERLIRNNWSAVEAVAGALMQHKTLTLTDVIRIIGYPKSRRAIQHAGIIVPDFIAQQLGLK
jgi:ATP-dependent Zn protease